MPANVVIRPGTVEDLEAVKAIYDGYVATSVATFDTVPSSRSSWEEKVSFGPLGMRDHGPGFSVGARDVRSQVPGDPG